MAKVHLHYDGWLALPEAERRKLGVASGDQLEVEYRDGTVVLRPTRRVSAAGRVVPEPAAAAEQSVEVAPTPEASPAAEVAPVVKRRPGRPRKVPADLALPTGAKARGRRAPAPAA